MKKKFLSLLLTTIVAFSLFVACGDKTGAGNSSDNGTTEEQIDYAAQVKLDMNSETLKQEVTLENHIDGDTSHFNVPNSIVAGGKLKARYLAVNTPESTGQIEEWGKKASNYTKTALTSAKSIIIETNGTQWEVDSTGERYLVWVWYKTAEMTDYRCLNIELLQNGLAVGSKASSTRYGDICVKAIDQAARFELHVHSDEKDPDFYYGNALIISLRELCLNKDDYLNKRVAFEGIVTQYYNNGIFVEEYDESADTTFGMYVYYGFGLNPAGEKILKAGNRVRIVGEAGNQFGYQISNLKYNPYKPDDPDNIKLIEQGVQIPCREITSDLYTNNAYTVTWSEESENGETVKQSKTASFLELAHNTHVSMKNLNVVDAYTTESNTESNGAITLTCSINGKTVNVRTTVLKDENGNIIKQDQYLDKTIDVTGIIDYYEDRDQYQLMVFSPDDIVVH